MYIIIVFSVVNPFKEIIWNDLWTIIQHTNMYSINALWFVFQLFPSRVCDAQSIFQLMVSDKEVQLQADSRSCSLMFQNRSFLPKVTAREEMCTFMNSVVTSVIRLEWLSNQLTLGAVCGPEPWKTSRQLNEVKPRTKSGDVNVNPGVYVMELADHLFAAKINSIPIINMSAGSGCDTNPSSQNCFLKSNVIFTH